MCSGVLQHLEVRRRKRLQQRLLKQSNRWGRKQTIRERGPGTKVCQGRNNHELLDATERLSQMGWTTPLGLTA